MRSVPSTSERGFTLVEVAVTLIIASIVMAIALPALRDLVRSNRVKQVSTDMLMSLSYARNEAINRNSPVSVVASGTWTTGWQVVAGGTVLRQTQLSGEVAVATTSGDTVTYTPNGRLAAGTAASFSFSIPGNTTVVKRCVAVGLVGQPTAQVDSNRDGDCTNG